MLLDNNRKVFFALLTAGLWEKDFQLSQVENIDYSVVFKLAQEQAVVGLVAAGIEHGIDLSVPKEDALSFIGASLLIEKTNKGMSVFIAELIENMRAADIYALLLKGLGLAQCYERPLWRSCGDVDFFLSDSNYTRAKEFLTRRASNIEEESSFNQHLAMYIDGWEVELHGTLRGGLWRSIDYTMDRIRDDIFCGGSVRSWKNGYTQIFLPAVNEDVVFVFSHILQHLYQGGVGLRQICDWCRLLWSYKGSINVSLLEKRIERAGIMTEWKTFGALAVNYLGMPQDAMPFYSPSQRWKKKSDIIIERILLVGNFGKNIDRSFIRKDAIIKRKIKTFWNSVTDNTYLLTVFPWDSIKVYWNMIKRGCLISIQGKR